MDHFKTFIDLTRLNKPIGYMLLFWPCSWGLAYAYNFNQNLNIFLFYLLLFFLGSLLMRSAGCIFNDIVDKEFDKKVFRTKKRPIASGKISEKKSFLYIVALCALAFLVLIQFNFLTILLGLGSMILAFSYPYMKRITYWPQLFLGLTFNWGIIMAWAALNNNISYDAIVLYISAIFWTLGYDTIYGAQDIADDEIIGVKSTSIKFKKSIKLFVSTCYVITCSIIIYIFKDNLGLNFSTLFMIIFFLSLIFQLIIFRKTNSSECLKAFKMNNYAGFFLFLAILLK
jgi:4-hydroxybenzoate polyprenyltransferase